MGWPGGRNNSLAGGLNESGTKLIQDRMTSRNGMHNRKSDKRRPFWGRELNPGFSDQSLLKIRLDFASMGLSNEN
jgi:hypothetical protein